MEKSFGAVYSYGHSIDNWGLSMFLGVLFFIMGIFVFTQPGNSYLAFSALFGIMVILSGAFELYLGSKATGKSAKGWLIAGGIVEIILGIFLLSIPSLLFSILPFILGFWLLFRGFTTVGIASDMMGYGVRNAGWTMAFGISVIFCAFFILFHPILGVGLVVVWIGISLLFTGLGLIVHAIQLKQIKKELE
ncbi:MAG: DUF308 domain-containing protein [Alistipes sp.]